MKIKTKFLLSLLVIFLVVALSGCSCKRNSGSNYEMELEVWGLFDDQDAYADIFEEYIKINPNIKRINYRKFTPDTYRDDLLEALAAGQGPDIFLINNTWLPSFQDKLVPASPELISEKLFRENFVDVVAQDFLSQVDEQTYAFAMPLSVDSLALYYNKDLLNEAGISAPPSSWEEFMDDIKLLTRIESGGEIGQAGAALGTAYNINRSTDLLSLLMLQNGTQMVDLNKKTVTFNQDSGENALLFYTQFSDSSSSVYTWNPRMHYSLDSFSEGKTAMMFNYSWHVPTIRSKSPKLNFSVSEIPQFSDGTKINYANYWGYGVSKITGQKTDERSGTPISEETRQKEAWLFLKWLTVNRSFIADFGKESMNASQFDAASQYVSDNWKPAARRDLVEKQKNEVELGVFAQQNLFARSWYQKDPLAIESIMAEMIDQVNRGGLNVSQALNSAAKRINQL